MKTKNITVLLLLSVLFCPFFSMAQANDEKPLRDFQVSILPFVGTEGRAAINYRYRFSLNVFAGSTGGLDGFEAGWFMNMDNGSVKGAQVSGFGNIVHGNVEGFQGAGFMNINHGSTKAFHGAGFINFITGSAEGFLSAGFINVTGGSTKGFSGAGFLNVVGNNAEGFQGAGFANVTGGSYRGLQGAGFANVTGGNFKGLQGAGFANVTGGKAKGLQLAGFMNVNNYAEGMQIAGFLNIAEKVKGVQLGFLNIADTVAGVPIGFLSIVKKGAYRQFEFSGSDVMHLGASFRIGVPVFYNIFSFGVRPFTNEEVWGFGYGIGSEIKLSKPAALQIELHSTQLRENWNNDWENLDLVSEFRLTFSIALAQRIILFAGPVFYNHIYEHNPAKGITGSDIARYTISKRHWDDYVSKCWIGERFGVRLKLN